MEKKAEFSIFFIDFHRIDYNIHVRAVVSNIGDIDGSCRVNCYVKNTVSDENLRLVASADSEVLSSGGSCTVSLKFTDSDIAYKTDNYSLLKAGEYIVSLGENEFDAVEVYAFNVNEDTYL